MGTINYRTGKHITLGLDDKFIEQMEDDFVEYNWIEEFFETFKSIKDEYYFNFFDVKLEYGYYDGFYIAVDDNEWAYLDDTEERKEVMQEIRQLQEFLTKCIDNGLVVTYPGWCTSYLDYKQSKIALRKTMHNIRDMVHKIPTYRRYIKTSHLHS